MPIVHRSSLGTIIIFLLLRRRQIATELPDTESLPERRGIPVDSPRTVRGGRGEQADEDSASDAAVYHRSHRLLGLLQQGRGVRSSNIIVHKPVSSTADSPARDSRNLEGHFGGSILFRFTQQEDLQGARGRRDFHARVHVQPDGYPGHFAFIASRLHFVSINRLGAAFPSRLSCVGVVEEGLDTFRKVEVSESCRREGEQHPNDLGPISESRRSIAEGIRGHLVHLTTPRRFLRAGLSTRWGLYVWRDLDYFSVDNHLINSPCSFRGRPITESNIQEYVSDLTSKFLPSGKPPWQVHVINCFLRGEEQQVCLVRAHHLLLRREHLTLADFLPLKYSTENWSCQDVDSPFTNLYAEPSALPKLYQKLTESFSNYWNEFLYNNDPNERPEILKKPIGIFHCVKIAVIILVSSLKELTRHYRKGEGPGIFNILSILKREASKRNFGFRVFFRALLKSINPLDALCCTVCWFWYTAITVTLKSPILVLRELRALKSRHKHYYPDTLTSMLWYYLPLVMQASIEALSITWIAIKAPKMILEELFLKHPQVNRLQTTSPCGRKVVAWSEEVELDLLRKISHMTGATETEILLAATVDALKEYFRHSGARIPDAVLATGKFIRQGAIFVQNHEARGILCLALPTKTPLFEDDPVEILQVIQKNVREARSKQSAIYAITAAEASCGFISSSLPSLLLKVMLNQLTRRYSVTLSHVDGELLVEGADMVMYWRPPQGNCNMSITLHRYGNGVRLGVMGDALIGPEHTIITRTFPKSVSNLANVIGVPRTPSRTSTPSPDSPNTSPGY